MRYYGVASAPPQCLAGGPRSSSRRRQRCNELPLARGSRGALGPGPALPAQALDLGDALGRHRSAVSDGRRAPVTKHPLAARPIPPQPVIRGTEGKSGGVSRGGDCPALFLDAANHKGSTLRRQARILVYVQSIALLRIYR